MTARVDAVIARVRNAHSEYWARVQKGECQAGTQGGDVLLVTHGHFSKCFLARWIETDLKNGKHFIVDAGGGERLSAAEGASATTEYVDSERGVV
jgi:probable phosphoglycerate mutase